MLTFVGSHAHADALLLDVLRAQHARKQSTTNL